MVFHRRIHHVLEGERRLNQFSGVVEIRDLRVLNIRVGGFVDQCENRIKLGLKISFGITDLNSVVSPKNLPLIHFEFERFFLSA